MTQDSRVDTHEHIRLVQAALALVITDLLHRGINHDQSKLHPPEVEVFNQFSSKLADVTYDSPEYRGQLKQMEDALAHHYAQNDHHPEHEEQGIRGMSLMQLVEMLCDWWAASQRHNDGDIRSSIETNQIRFGYSDELKAILLNTVDGLERM